MIFIIKLNKKSHSCDLLTNCVLLKIKFYCLEIRKEIKVFTSTYSLFMPAPYHCIASMLFKLYFIEYQNTYIFVCVFSCYDHFPNAVLIFSQKYHPTSFTLHRCIFQFHLFVKHIRLPFPGTFQKGFFSSWLVGPLSITVVRSADIRHVSSSK